MLKPWSFEAQDVTDFYNEVTQAYAVQDAIFQILLRFQKMYGLSIMESNIAIAPRYVNEILVQEMESTEWMLDTLERFVEVISTTCTILQRLRSETYRECYRNRKRILGSSNRFRCPSHLT